MKFSKLYIIGICILAGITANAQSVFKRTYGAPTGFNEGNSVVQTPDSGFIVVGVMSGIGGGASDVMMIKTDKNGIQQWIKPFGWANVDVAKNIKTTTDGNYVFCGYTNSVGNGGYDVLLVKIDPAGETIWAHTYGGSDWDFGYNVALTDDGGYIISGETYSYGQGNNDFYIVKTDAQGVMQWQQTIGTARNDVGRGIMQAYDGTYIVVGYTTQPNNTAINDILFARLAANGDTLFTRKKATGGDDYAFDVAEVPQDSSYHIVGHTSAFSTPLFDGYILHYDKDDTELTPVVLNSNTYSTKMYSCALRQSNGDLVVAGETKPEWDTKPFALVNMVNINGIYIWGYDFNAGFDEEYYTHVINGMNGGFVLVGTNKSTGPGITSAFLMTISPAPAVAPNVTVDVPEATIGLKTILYPNPTTGVVRFGLQSQAKNLSVIVYDAVGKEVFNKTYNGVQQVEEDFSQLGNGLYQARITADGKYTAQTFVIAR